MFQPEMPTYVGSKPMVCLLSVLWCARYPYSNVTVCLSREATSSGRISVRETPQTSSHDAVQSCWLPI